MSSREPLEECPPEEHRIAVFTLTQTEHGCWYIFFIFILLEGVGSKHPVGINIQKAWNLTFAYSPSRGSCKTQSL